MDKVPRAKKKSHFVSYLILILVLVGGGYLFATSSFFDIRTVNVVGTRPLEKYTKEDIMSKIGVTLGMNLFKFNFSKAKSALANEAYINSYKVKMSPPNAITVNIEERIPRGYVMYLGSAFYIDSEGRVLESTNTPSPKYPEVVGLRFDNISIGKILDVKDTKTFQIVVDTAQLIAKYDLSNIVTVDVSDTTNVKLLYADIVVMVGDASNYDEKIKMMIEILKTVEGNKGILKLQNTDNATFEYQ